MKFDEFKEKYGTPAEGGNQSNKPKPTNNKTNKNKSNSVNNKKPVKKGTAADKEALRKVAEKLEREKANRKRKASKNANKKTKAHYKEPKGLEIAIMCPVHSDTLLDTGIKRKYQIPDGKGKQEENYMFYCPNCKKYYFISDIVEIGVKVPCNGVMKAECVDAPVYKKIEGGWKHVELHRSAEKTGNSSDKNSTLPIITVEQETKEEIEKKERERQKVLAIIERKKDIEKKFNPESDTLYIHKGLIKCLLNDHDVISVTLQVPTEEKGKSGTVNANYCLNCDKFFMSIDNYNDYQKINQIMIVKFHFLEGTTYDSVSNNWAEKSPLMLAGYSVEAKKDYSDEKRARILSSIMDNGILKKYEIINYLDHFINLRKNQPNMQEAIRKWKKDRVFVNNYKINEQKKHNIKQVKQYK